MPGVHMFQSKLCLSNLSDMYILSILECEPVVCWRNVYSLVVGFVYLHPSCTWNMYLRLHSASTAFELSEWLCMRAMGSSTILWSPRKMSGFGRFSVCHISFRVVQKVSFSEGAFGAYVASIFISRSRCHGRVMSRALPWINTLVLTFWIFVISLFSTMATPFEFGSSGFIVWKIFSLLLKRVCSWSTCLFSRWVSCRARTPILWSFVIWFIL